MQGPLEVARGASSICTIMKEILISVGTLICVAALGLSIASKISDAYRVADNAIFRSTSINASIGSIDFTVLLGLNQNIRVNDTSCGNLIFLVLGRYGFEYVEVLVRKRPSRNDWEVYEIVEGFHSRSNKLCNVPDREGSRNRST